MRRLIFCMLMLASLQAFPQRTKLSDQAQFSLLTMGPDQEEFYEAFGHSAVRLVDPVLGIDFAYNYGVFSFNQPYFYLNFAKGHLNYALAIQSYPDFKEAYISYNRFIHEQVLNLNQDQKQKVFEFLQWNAQPENRFYRYDYFFNNCSTRIRDLLADILKGDLKYDQSFIKTDYTIRQLTDLYLAQQPWGDLGIDIGLGSRIDKKATPEEYMFLPDYLEFSFDHATIRNNGVVMPLVSEKRAVYTAHAEDDAPGWLNPWIALGTVLVITVLITAFDWKREKLSGWFDSILFLVTGFLGLVLLLLWVATDHHACARNYNLLWALPTNLVAGVMVLRKNKPVWLLTYFKVTSVITLIVLGTWKVIPQQINLFLVPFILALALRYFTNWLLTRTKAEFKPAGEAKQL